MSTSDAKPAIEGWFTTNTDAPALIGSRCTACSSYYFPIESTRCRNPYCGGSELEEVELSRTGKVWSVTSASYAPPKPFIADEPFQPFAIVAVELEKEKMVVLGRAKDGVNAKDLKAGDRVEVILERGYTDDEGDKLVWKFQPIQEEA